MGKRPVHLVDYNPSNPDRRLVKSCDLGPYRLKKGFKNLQTEVWVTYEAFQPTMKVEVCFSVDVMDGYTTIDRFHPEFGEVSVKALPVQLHLDLDTLTESYQAPDYDEPVQLLADILGEQIAKITSVTMSGEDEDDTPKVRIHIEGVGFQDCGDILSAEELTEFNKFFEFAK